MPLFAHFTNFVDIQQKFGYFKAFVVPQSQFMLPAEGGARSEELTHIL